MPHYANGEAAAVGDLVMTVDERVFPKILGQVVSITIGSDSCNAQVLAFARRYSSTEGTSWIPNLPQYTDCVTLSQMGKLVVEPPGEAEQAPDKSQ